MERTIALDTWTISLGRLGIYVVISGDNIFTLHSPQKRLETIDGDIVDSENAVRFEMGDALKLHGAQT